MKKVPIFYINLEHREDRRAEFELEVQKIEPIAQFVERIPGVLSEEYGAIGCAASHVHALIRFITCTASPTAIVFEDDFEFTVGNDEALTVLASAVDQMKQASVIQLSYNRALTLKTELPNLVRILKSTTASGYIINREFAYKLVPIFLQSHKALVELSGLRPIQLASDLAAIDVFWNSLQVTDGFFGLAKPIGRQRRSFSDIVRRVVDYGR